MAIRAQVLAVHRGYIIAAMATSSVALAAAVVTGTGVDVGAAANAGVAVGALLTTAVGDDEEPHETSRAIVATDVIAASFLDRPTRSPRSWTRRRGDSIAARPRSSVDRAEVS